MIAPTSTRMYAEAQQTADEPRDAEGMVAAGQPRRYALGDGDHSHLRHHRLSGDHALVPARAIVTETSGPARADSAKRNNCCAALRYTAHENFSMIFRVKMSVCGGGGDARVLPRG